MNPLQIREKIAEKHAQAQAVVKLAEEEDRDLTEQDQTQFDNLLAEIGEDKAENSTGLYKDLYRSERLESLTLSLNAPAKKPQQAAAVATPADEYNIRSLGYVNTGPLKAFKNERDAYTCGMWLKAAIAKDKGAIQWCRDRGVGFRGAQTEGTDSQGGYSVPDILESTVLEVRNQTGILNEIADVFPMSSDVLKIPTLVSGQTVVYPGEATAITASDAVWGVVTATAVKRAVLTKVSWELINDSVVNVADIIASRAGYELALTADDELVNGDGSAYGGVTGLVDTIGAGGTVTSSSATFAGVTLAELNTVAGTLPDEYHEGASWIMGRAFFAGAVQRLIYSAGGNTALNIADGTGAQLFGYRIRFVSAMPSEAVSIFGCFFGNFEKSVVVGQRTGIDVMTSEHAYFDEDVLAIKLISRYDTQVHRGSGSSANGYVGLKTAAS